MACVDAAAVLCMGIVQCCIECHSDQIHPVRLVPKLADNEARAQGASEGNTADREPYLCQGTGVPLP